MRSLDQRLWSAAVPTAVGDEPWASDAAMVNLRTPVLHKVEFSGKRRHILVDCGVTIARAPPST